MSVKSKILHGQILLYLFLMSVQIRSKIYTQYMSSIFDINKEVGNKMALNFVEVVKLQRKAKGVFV